MEPLVQARRAILESLPLFLQLRRRHWTGLQTFLDQSHLTRPAFFLLRALEEETIPEQPLTVQYMQETLFNPYATRFPWVEDLPLLIEQGYLEQQDENYSVTQTARLLLQHIERAARAYIGSLRLPPAISLPALAEVLIELVHRAWQAPEPLIKAHQGRTQRRLPVEGASALVQVEWAILGLWEARDDAHIAAWRAARFSGPVVDILSRIWRKEAQTLADLMTILEGSQWPADIEQGIERLAQWGYIQTSGDHIELTLQGQQIRDQIEAETDHIFFAFWEHMAVQDVLWLAEQMKVICAFLRTLSN